MVPRIAWASAMHGAQYILQGVVLLGLIPLMMTKLFPRPR